MALKIKCDKCKKELKEPGALLFSPPTWENAQTVERNFCKKFHICAKCYNNFLIPWVNYEQ